MKVSVTSLKAPWPEGVVLGSVVALPFDAIPDSLLGKCVPAEDGADAVAEYVPPTPPEPRDYTSGLVQLHTAPAGNDDLQATQALLTEARIEADELRARVAKAEEALAQRDAELAEAKAALAKAEEALAAKAGKAKG